MMTASVESIRYCACAAFNPIPSADNRVITHPSHEHGVHPQPYLFAQNHSFVISTEYSIRKSGPKARLSVLLRNVRLHAFVALLALSHHLASATLLAFATALLHHEDFPECSDTHEDVDDCFDLHPLAEEHVHDVPVLAHEHSDSDESPVEGTDQNEDNCNRADSAFLTHKE